jgi:hypothetical protein
LKDLAIKISENQDSESAVLTANALGNAIDDAMVYSRHPTNSADINNSFGLSIFSNTTDTTILIYTEGGFDVYADFYFSTDSYFSSYCKILDAIEAAIQ